MDKYQFYHGNSVTDLDMEGIELPDLDSAKRLAAQMLGELLRAPVKHWMDVVITVTDVSGLVLFTMRAVDQESSAIPKKVSH